MARSLSRDSSPALCGDLQNAPVVFAAGRGVGNEDTFRLLVVLAERFGAQVAGTRPAVDAAWIGHRRELGLSGLRVSPALYIGFGVSGTNFHTMGMRKSEMIVAVNTDPSARIAEMADIFIAEDVHAFLEALQAACPEEWTAASPPEPSAAVV